MRLAFLSPLPPSPTGIADYSAEVLDLLAGRHELDVFHAQDEVERGRLPAGSSVLPASAFLARHAERPYDAAVYQMGNSLAHAFLYDLLARVPGLLVLHDLVLHHARARQFLDHPATRAYAAAPWDSARRDAALVPLSAYADELAHAYPAQARRLADVQLATVGDLLPYAYPLFRLPAEASRAVAAHSAYVLEAVAEELPGKATARVVMPIGRVPVSPGELERLRTRYGLGRDAFVVGCFGLLTREKRVETVARAVARAAGRIPSLRLLLVGPVPDAEVLRALLGRVGVEAITVTPGRVPFAELAAHMELADVVAHLRYPTARETSAALLRVLAQGRPTVMSDLEHLADVPADAVVRADVADEEGELTRALLRLAEQPARRQALGQRAAAFVAREHSPAACLASYEAALALTAAEPDPPHGAWPPHWPRPSA